MIGSHEVDYKEFYNVIILIGFFISGLSSVMVAVSLVCESPSRFLVYTAIFGVVLGLEGVVSSLFRFGGSK